ncbi:MAG: ABC transporter permease [Verrucomicrobiota bacterium]|jgi:lipoprotein-releasing system permease protein|nr:ABC transporter permease [Verrucomicrobiota bacterium]
MPFPLFLALKYLRPKRSVISVVTLISVLGVVLGVAIIIIVRAVMTGFGDMWQEKILDFKPHISIVANGAVIEDEEAVCQRLEQVPGVIAASPSLETRVLVEHRHRVVAPLIIGTDPNRARRVMKLDRLASGEFNIEGDSALLGVDLAAELGIGAGDEILVYSPMNVVTKDEVYFPERLTVTGVFDSGQRDFDTGFVITSIAVARDLMGMRSGVYSIHLRVENPQNTAAFTRIVNDVRALAPPRTSVRTWQELDNQIFNALAVEKNMMVLLLMFITIVAIFCVTNTLIVLTEQKTDEIGLLKALGFSSRQVMGAFVLHGWMQCLTGTLLGIGAALLILNNLQHLVDGLARLGVEVFPKSIYGLSAIPWRVVPSEIAVVAVAVILFCTAASLLPAWRAARLDPVTALRKE